MVEQTLLCLLRLFPSYWRLSTFTFCLTAGKKTLGYLGHALLHL
ncbi:hypothetical protein CIB84_010296 [Bambusicola thoracicus]|uniref:Uncharacterized protein n=1 Tax=Bambusicola thoracicus TaxID=9083 RepID=A0A2P4SPD4_BAMTH|nr:hypothetical protein CIB84_010296 [Bambusicola thoracicus]